MNFNFHDFKNAFVDSYRRWRYGRWRYDARLAPVRMAIRRWRQYRGPIRRWCDARLRRQVFESTGMIPFDQSREEDVFIIGFQKSGHTWFQSIVAGLIYDLDVHHAHDELIQELVPDPRKTFYRRFQTPMFFKEHTLPIPRIRRVVYLLRDGRDAMVSLYHYLRASGRTDVTFLNLLQNEVTPKWHEHVEAWLDNPYKADILQIKYEDMKLNPLKELRRLCTFVGIERDDDAINRVIAMTTFEKMREREGRFGWATFPKHTLPKGFIRRGVAGSHKDEMPPEVLEAFMAEAGSTMKKCGYV